MVANLISVGVLVCLMLIIVYVRAIYLGKIEEPCYRHGQDNLFPYAYSKSTYNVKHCVHNLQFYVKFDAFKEFLL